MVTNYRLIMLALVQGRSWSQITSDLGCSRSSIDKASRVLRSTGMDEDTITALSPQELSELFPDNRRRDSDAFVEPDFGACQVVCVWGVIIKGRARSGQGKPQTSG